MELPLSNNDELVTCLAALALYDGEAEITSAQITALLTATNNTAAPYFPVLFAGFLKDNIDRLVFSLGGPAAAPAGGAVAAAGGDAGAEAAAPAEKVKEEAEEVDLGGGMDMFGGEEGGSY